MATRFRPIKNHRKLKEAHKSQNFAEIETSMAALNAAWTAASEDIYKTQEQPGGEQQPGGGPGAQANAGSDNVTDVPYEEVK